MYFWSAFCFSFCVFSDKIYWFFVVQITYFNGRNLLVYISPITHISFWAVFESFSTVFRSVSDHDIVRSVLHDCNAGFFHFSAPSLSRGPFCRLSLSSSPSTSSMSSPTSSSAVFVGICIGSRRYLLRNNFIDVLLVRFGRT